MTDAMDRTLRRFENALSRLSDHTTSEVDSSDPIEEIPFVTLTGAGLPIGGSGTKIDHFDWSPRGAIWHLVVTVAWNPEHIVVDYLAQGEPPPGSLWIGILGARSHEAFLWVDAGRICRTHSLELSRERLGGFDPCSGVPWRISLHHERPPLDDM